MKTDSLRTGKNARRAALRRGLTLVELLLVIVVMGVVMMITAPRLRGIAIDSNVRSASQELTNRLAIARQTAIRRGSAAILHVANDKAWLMVENKGSQSVVGDTVHFSTKYSTSVSATIDSVRYNARGFANLGSTQTFTITRESTTERVCVTASGLMLGRGCSL